jgi:hypothetical protein
MRPSVLSTLTIGFVATFVIASCQKTYNPGAAQNSTTTSTTTQSNAQVLSDFYTMLTPSPQSITVTAGVAQTVYGSKGTVLNFYPNSFKDKNGNIITSGSVSIQLTEMYKPGDMIANQASTITPDGQFLQSGGQLNIAATMNGQEVFANKYGIAFKVSDTTANAVMSLFYGNKPKDSTLTWKIGNTTENPGTIATPTHGAGGAYLNLYYLFDSCTSFHYINCDRFEGPGAWTHLFISAPDTGYNGSNTNIYLILPTMNSIAPNDCTWKLFDSVTNKYEFICHSTNIPVGVTYKVVIIANKYGNYYYYEHADSTTASSINVTPFMTRTTLTDITNKLKAL